MDELKFQHIYRDTLTTIFGTLLIGGAVYYFFTNLKTITWENLAILLGIGAIGIFFLVAKDSVILRFVPGYKDKVTDEPNEDASKL